MFEIFSDKRWIEAIIGSDSPGLFNLKKLYVLEVDMVSVVGLEKVFSYRDQSGQKNIKEVMCPLTLIMKQVMCPHLNMNLRPPLLPVTMLNLIN